MKPQRQREKLARRQAAHDAFMGSTRIRDEGPSKRRASGGYHRPGSVNKSFGKRK